MGLLPNIGYPQTGEITNVGTYACMNCSSDNENNNAVIVLEKEKKLPKCPVCKKPTYWLPI